VASRDSFKSKSTLTVGGKTYTYFSIPEAEKNGLAGVSQLPHSMKVVLENLLRFEDDRTVKRDDILAIAEWMKTRTSEYEISYRPARVLMQDFTGVPAVVDLAAMRDATAKLGANPQKINPLVPVDLVIDHSVMVDNFGTPLAFAENVELEYERNGERYEFLRWGQSAFDNFRVVPPGTGICHQVNLEYLAQTVWTKDEDGETVAYPDTLVGTDSHTTMVNGLSVLGWGVGGIEAEAAMLGQPITMLIPEVVGFKLTGRINEGITATDLVLTVTQMLRKQGVVGKFVEFYGPGLDYLSLEDQATIANMAPEYGATCGFFPVDADSLKYLTTTGRDPDRVALVEAYSKAQGMFRETSSPDPIFTATLELDLTTVVPSISGPKRPQDRIVLAHAKQAFAEALPTEFSKTDMPAMAVEGVQEGARRRSRGRGRRSRHPRRRRGDRCDHLVHQHLQSFGAGCRRSCCPQGAGAGPQQQALGQDFAGARLAGGHRLFDLGRPPGRSRRTGLQPRGLWLHHLHRQFRPATGRDQQGRAGRRSGRCFGALG
jgi:aconitate hydratase